MNYYRRYLGDYMRDTMHLSIMEHGAYNLMLDACYATEKPLPAAYESLFRICRAMLKPEQEAVRKVADEFFPVGPDGYRHNPRADREISIGQSTIEKQRKSGVESASKRWSTDESTHKSTVESSIQPPTTNHQPPSASLQPPDKSNVGLDARQILAFLNEKAGRRYQANRVNLGFIVGRLKDGATVTECRQVIAKKCREWGTDEKMDKYLRPATLFNSTKFSQYQGELVVAPADVSRETSAPATLQAAA